MIRIDELAVSRRVGAWFAAAVLLAVTWSWFGNLPKGAGAGLTAIGQLTGFACSLAALLTVALMARVPLVTDVIGSDRSVQWHRWAATATVVLLAVHIVATVLGYAAADKAGVGHEIANLVTTYPWMLSATVGAGILFAVAATSVRRLRQRMRFESWLFAHWYSYLAVALAFGHEIVDGASFSHATGPTLAWTWLHVLVLCTVGWYRVLLPLWRMLTHPLVVADVVREGPHAVSIVLSGSRLDTYGARAGQHIRVRFLTRTGWWQSHPFSFSSVPSTTQWRITVVASGDNSTALLHLRPGTRAVVSGVYGSLPTDVHTDAKVLLIGGGSGITPLRSLLEDLPAGIDTRVLYRAGREEDLVLRHELDALAARPGSDVLYVVGSRPTDPRHDPLSPGGLRHLVPDVAVRDAFVCGHAGFVETVFRSLKANGVPTEHIHTERFDP